MPEEIHENLEGNMAYERYLQKTEKKGQDYDQIKEKSKKILDMMKTNLAKKPILNVEKDG